MNKFFTIITLIFTLFSSGANNSDTVAYINEFYAGINNGYSKDIEINNIDKQIIKLNENDYSNLKITCIGDAITYGTYIEDEDIRLSYCDVINNILDCEVLNLGIGKSTIGQYYNDYSFYNRAQDIPRDSDIVIIFGGINDYMFQGEYGEFGDFNKSKTYCGDLKGLIEQINEICNNPKIFFITTYKNINELCFNNDDTHLYSFSDYMNAQIEIANEYDNVNVIDIYNIGFLDGTNTKTKNELFVDNILLNKDGMNMLGEHIAAELILHLFESIK